jgi:hypothetical protein
LNFEILDFSQDHQEWVIYIVGLNLDGSVVFVRGISSLNADFQGKE